MRITLNSGVVYNAYTVVQSTQCIMHLYAFMPGNTHHNKGAARSARACGRLSSCGAGSSVGPGVLRNVAADLLELGHDRRHRDLRSAGRAEGSSTGVETVVKSVGDRQIPRPESCGRR